MKIWKYELKIGHNVITEINMPIGYSVLKVGVQEDKICLWASVEPKTPKLKRHFICYYTGQEIQPIPDRFIHEEHIDTVIFGNLVLHYFELVNIGSDVLRLEEE